MLYCLLCQFFILICPLVSIGYFSCDLVTANQHWYLLLQYTRYTLLHFYHTFINWMILFLKVRHLMWCFRKRLFNSLLHQEQEMDLNKVPVLRGHYKHLSMQYDLVEEVTTPPSAGWIYYTHLWAVINHLLAAFCSQCCSTQISTKYFTSMQMNGAKRH